MVGVRQLDVGVTAREEHPKDLGKVGVYLVKHHQELTAHLTLDGARDLCERLLGALEVGHLLGDVVRALLQAQVLVHGDLVDRTDAVELPTQLLHRTLHDLAIIRLRQRERVLQNPAVRRDVLEGTLDLHLDTAEVNPEVVGNAFGTLKLL